MADYNFEDDDRSLGETIRLETLNEKVKKLEKLQGYNMSDTIPAVEEKPKAPVRRTGGGSGGKKPSHSKVKQYIFLAVMAGIVLFMIMFSGFFFASRGTVAPNEQNTPILDSDVIATVDGEKAANAMILDNSDSKKLVIFDIDNQNKVMLNYQAQEYSVNIDGNKNLKIQDLKLGQLIHVVLNDENYIQEIRGVDNGWVRQNVQGFKISDYFDEILYNDKNYKISNNCVFIYEGEFISVREINPEDIILLRGIGDDIYCVEVTSKQGYVHINGVKDIVNAKILVDDIDKTELLVEEKIPASVGTHVVKISGDNIDGIVQEIEVTADTAFEIDITKNIGKTFVLKINANVKDFMVSIDRSVINEVKNTFRLDDGEHLVTIIKDGYVTQEHTINNNGKDELELNVLMEEAIKQCKYTFETDEIGATVLIDGIEIGKTPLTKSVKFGSHRLVIKKAGFEEISVMIDTNKEVESLYFEMNPQ